MTDFNLPNLAPAFPELFLALASMLFLMMGVFGFSSKTIARYSMLALILAIVLLFIGPAGPVTTFGGLFIQDGFAIFMKTLVLTGSLITILISGQFLRDKNIDRFEFHVLIVLATLGMLMMISANDFLSLYVGLELQSLSLYVLAAFNRDRPKSTEAGLKYFVLGALSSGMLLYGISLVYGFAGTTSFETLAQNYQSGADISTGLILGLVFVLVGLAFKISAVPFHMWTPDVYEGAPTPITAFFAAAPKVAAMALTIRVLMGAFPQMADQWTQIIVFISIGSMLVGAFVALVQTNIKRLMAYSSIGHVGYALVGLAAGSFEGIQGIIIYMTIYMTMTLGAFAGILSMRRDGGMVEDINDLAGLGQTRPGMAAAISIFMFSLAGIPLLAGFFGKFFIIMAAVNVGLYVLAGFAFVTSVVGAYYYLRIVKIIYFDDPAPQFEPNDDKSIGMVMGLMAILNSPVSFFLIYPLIYAAGIAAGALLS